MINKLAYFSLIGLFLLVFVGCAVDAQASNPETLYPAVMQVVEVNADEDLLVLADFNGNAWEWEGVDDWQVGDLAGLIMNDCGTVVIYDDEIVSIRYCGWVNEWGA
jgi:hypothetical protein